jgi:hypothetical protein
VEGIGAAGFGQLVYQVKDHRVNFRVQRAVTAAVNSFVVGILARGFIKLGMRPEQGEGVFSPGLMAQAVDLRDEAHADVATGTNQPGNFLRIQGALLADLGPARETVAVAELEHENVDPFLRQGFADEPLGQLDVLGPGRAHVQAADGGRAGGYSGNGQSGNATEPVASGELRHAHSMAYRAAGRDGTSLTEAGAPL